MKAPTPRLEKNELWYVPGRPTELLGLIRKDVENIDYYSHMAADMSHYHDRLEAAWKRFDNHMKALENQVKEMGK